MTFFRAIHDYCRFKFLSLVHQIDLAVCMSMNANFGASNLSNIQPWEVVGRGSETQLVVGENVSYIIRCYKTLNTILYLYVIKRRGSRMITENHYLE